MALRDAPFAGCPEQLSRGEIVRVLPELGLDQEDDNCAG